MKSSITSPYDILSIANREWTDHLSNKKKTLFDLMIVSANGEPVTCFNGTQMTPDRGIDDCDKLDIIFIPVIYGDLEPILSNQGLIDRLRDRNSRGTVICAVCAGVFLAAETGLLNKRLATTHWHLADAFMKRYPDVILKKEKMIVDQGDLITAGGVTAFIDLSLYLAGRFGSLALTASLSKTLLIDPARHLQTPYFKYHLNTTHKDENILRVQQWMQKNLTSPISVSKSAAQAGLSERTFARRFKKATGDTPLEYLQCLRINKARHLLETTNESFEAITLASGYEDVSSFRRLFKRTTGLSPTNYRKKFGLYPNLI